MEKVLCYCCNKSKAELTLKKSALMPINLLLCETCITTKIEPRWVVILSGRQYGHEYVKDYVFKKRYLGEEIKASELLV